MAHVLLEPAEWSERNSPSRYLYRDSTIQLVKVPDRAIIDALRSGHAPIRNHVIKSIDPTPTQRIASS